MPGWADMQPRKSAAAAAAREGPILLSRYVIEFPPSSNVPATRREPSQQSPDQGNAGDCPVGSVLNWFRATAAPSTRLDSTGGQGHGFVMCELPHTRIPCDRI